MLLTLGFSLSHRPIIESHVVSRREQKRLDARTRAQNLMSRMRAEAKLGAEQLDKAKHEAAAGHQPVRQPGSKPVEPWPGDPGGPGITQTGNGGGPVLQLHMHVPGALAGGLAQAAHAGVAGGGSGIMDLTHASKPPPASSAPTSIHDINVHLKESEAINAMGEEQASEKAFKCFVRAVHALQSLDLQGETVPEVGGPGHGHVHQACLVTALQLSGNTARDMKVMLHAVKHVNNAGAQ